METQKETIVSQRIIDKLVDKFLTVVEQGHSEFTVKVVEGKITWFGPTPVEKDEID